MGTASVSGCSTSHSLAAYVLDSSRGLLDSLGPCEPKGEPEDACASYLQLSSALVGVVFWGMKRDEWPSSVSPLFKSVFPLKTNESFFLKKKKKEVLFNVKIITGEKVENV